MLSQLEQQLYGTLRPRKQLSVFLEDRRLRPAFLLSGEVVAWRCNLCQRLFTIGKYQICAPLQACLNTIVAL